MKSALTYLTILFQVLVYLPVESQVPMLSSYPSASATVFLDFDGQYVSGSVWNWSGPIDAQPSGFNTADITEMFNRVAEDFRPFDLNITTDSTYYFNAPVNHRIRIIITPTSQWYGAAGGVAFVGSFNWGDNTPAWVFSALLGNRVKYVAEAISHETGHTLGLQHQSSFDVNCNKVAEYASGQGAGEIGWAPIMGVGYYQNLTTWHIGPNTAGCNSIQNDFDVVSTQNGFGLRPDDYGNDIAAATEVVMSGNSFVSSGLINASDDIDAFKMTVTNTTHFTLTAIPQNVGAGDAGANIDIKVVLLNNTDTIGTYNPSTLLNAGIDTTLNAGNYYLLINGVGNIYHNDNGSLGVYTLNGALATALPLVNFALQGSVLNDQHQLAWSFQSNEAVQQIFLESSEDGQHFITLAKINPAAKYFSYQPLAYGDIYYRLKAVTNANQQGYFSNTIVLKGKSVSGKLKVAGQRPGEIIVNSSGNFIYELFNAGGQLSGKGKLQQGLNYLPAPNVQGLLFLHYSNGSNSYIQKLIKQ
jgi:hypothetical protein